MRSVLNCLLGLLSLANSQAPGDADSFCLSPSAPVTPPLYPPNSKILMDSFQYIHLLPPLPGALATWQQVDVDNRTDSSGGRTSWFQASGFACRQRLSSCYFDTGGQNNWIITQHISRNVSGSLLPQVSVQVKFQLIGCTFGCQVSFLLQVWETSTIDRDAARIISNYRRVAQVAPTTVSSNISQNMSIPINFVSPNATGFYLAIVDENTCIALTRIIVFYHVCPKMVLNLIRYPETLSPPINDVKPQLLDGQCVDNAFGELQGGNPQLSCIQGGKWSVVQEGTGCRCGDGFIHIEVTDECIICSSGKYISPSSFSCLPCPANTQVDKAGIAVCECLMGYYRAPDENSDFGCSKPPGIPTDVSINKRTITSATISWKAPEDTGGRLDLFYRLWFQPEGGIRTLGSETNLTRGTITGLLEGTRYQFYVTAENGVSNVGETTPRPVLVFSETSEDNSTEIASQIPGNNFAVIIMMVVAVVVVIWLVSILIVNIKILALYQQTKSRSKISTPEAHSLALYKFVDDTQEDIAKKKQQQQQQKTTTTQSHEICSSP